MKKNKHGSIWVLLLVLFVIGSIAIYWGYNKYIQTLYIGFYDGNKIRYLDVPPFAERITPASLEVLGECDIRFSTIDEQVLQFFKATATKYGYFFSRADTKSDSSFEITVRGDYVIKGTFDKNILQLRWNPVLPPDMQKKARAMR